MKKKSDSFFLVLFAIVFLFASTYLLAHSHSDADNVERNEAPVELIDENKAVEIAKRFSHTEGWDITDYDLSVEDNDDYWDVSFEAPAPRAPGDAFTVIIDKSNGDAQIMYDE